MRFYWHDHTEKSENPHLAGLAKMVELFSASRVSTPDEFAQENLPRLAFVHAGNDDNITASDWEKIAADNAWIIRVSSVEIDQTGVPARVHRLRTPCRVIAGHLTPEIVRQFIVVCEGGNPNFDLLYPRPTDNLVALYLLELAELDSEEIKKMKERFSPEANKEYSEIKGADSELPQDHDKLLAELREVLTPVGSR